MLPRFDVVYYHSPCPDGDAAAYLMRPYADEFIPYTYGKSKIAIGDVRNKNVLFVDVCPPEETLKKVKDVSSSVYVLDHHPIEDMCARVLPKDSYCIDRSVCGAMLVWQRYYAPRWLQIINNYDTGQFHKLSDEDKAFHLAFCKDPDYETKNYEAYIAKGQALEKERSARVKTAVENSYTGEVNKLKVTYATISNVEDTAKTASALLHKYPDAAFAAVRKVLPDYCNFSLRRRPNDTINLQTIARSFGGGGHEAASAVQIRGHAIQFLG